MARNFTQRHYEAVASVLRDVSSMEGADSHTVAMIAFQLEKMFRADNPRFSPSIWVEWIFPERRS